MAFNIYNLFTVFITYLYINGQIYIICNIPGLKGFYQIESNKFLRYRPGILFIIYRSEYMVILILMHKAENVLCFN